MTNVPNHAQFGADAVLSKYLSENADTLLELLIAYADPGTMAALTQLREALNHGLPCRSSQITLIRDCLAAMNCAQGALRNDFESAVLWHGARLDEIIRFFERVNELGHSHPA